MSPLGAGSTAHPSYAAHRLDCDASSFGSPLMAELRRDTIITLNSVQSLCSIPVSGKMPTASQNNLSLASNQGANKEDSTAGSWAGAQCESSTPLSQGEAVALDRRPVFAAWNATRTADRGGSAAERSTAVRLVAPAEEKRTAASRDPLNCTGAAAAAPSDNGGRRDSTAFDDPARRWQPQGLFGGHVERLGVRAPNGDTGSLFAVVLNGEAPDDLPPLPPPAEEPRSRPSTPSVNAIQLRADYVSVTPFMSISSPFSASVRSVSRLRTSVQQLAGSSLHGLGSSASLSMALEMPMSMESATAEARSCGASALHAASVLARRGSEATKLREVTFVPAKLRDAGRSAMMTTADPSTFSPGNSTAKTHQPSPMNPNAATVPCSPVAYCAVPGSPAVLSGWKCASEEQRERRAIARDGMSSFEKLLEREVSAYLNLSRQQRAVARRRNESPAASAQQQLAEAERRQLHDSMHTRLRVAEVAHQDSLRSFQLQDSPPSASSAGERAPRTPPLPAYQLQVEGDDSTRTFPRGVPRLHGVTRIMDVTCASAPVPRQLSLEPSCASAVTEGRKGGGDPLISAEIQRQLRLGRQSVSKADARMADSVATELH